MIRTTMLRRLAVLPAFVFFAAAPAVHAQAAAPAAVQASVSVDPSLAGIDSMLAALYPASEPGAAVLVAHEGRVLMRKAYGSANVELGVPLRPEHVFRLGSITKQFTAVATLMLVEEGKVSLDDEITRFLPDYPTQGRRITVEHLLTHTSGIQSYTSVPGFAAGIRRELAVDSLIAFFAHGAMEFAPGERWNYNNSGYALLGAIIEKVSGMTYADFIRTRIFEPLGMRSSAYEVENVLVPGRVDGYERTDEGAVRRADWMSMSQPYAAGALISTVDDLMVWNRAVAEGRLLRPETWRRAFAPYTMSSGLSSGYGYGWFVGNVDGRPSVEHGGDINGFSTNNLWIPSGRLHVVVLANHEREPRRNPDEISRQIAARVLGQPAAPAAVTVEPAALDAYVGVYRISDTERRVVTRDGGALFSQRNRAPRQEMKALGGDEFLFPATGTRVRFVRGTDGAVTGVRLTPRRGPEELATRTEQTPEEALGAVAVPAAVLDRYVGRYQVAPDFIVTVRREGDALRVQPGSEEEIAMIAESETRFAIPAANGVVIFESDASGAVTRLVLHLGTRQMPAPRIP
ncbi:MAG TPA: serine hydrolase [Longimicrobium sp.]|jgi:CubicO group peptidase (beta-lactamase class C family)|uniref:serine hydrolase n=1 Tax=Longimicrobium sp. TaxID=2029185 RepID=UPI002ED9E9A1